MRIRGPVAVRIGKLLPDGLPTRVDALSVSTNPLDFDVACLSCGYNLRGLGGDPVRCPECGRGNPIHVFEVSEAQVYAQLRKLESPATICLVLTVITLAALILAIKYENIGCLLPVLVPVLFVWPALAREFQDSCRNHPRWFVALMRYQMCGFACLVLPLPLIWWAAMLADGLAGWLRIRSSNGHNVIQFVVVAGLICFLSLFVYRVYRYATGEMRALQRTTARDMALRTVRLRSLRQFSASESVYVGHNKRGAVGGDRGSSNSEAR